MQATEPTITLRAFLDLRINEMEHRITREMELKDAFAEERVRDMNRRLEGMNELRSQLDRQSLTFITGAQHDALRERLEGKVEAARSSGSLADEEISKRLDKLEQFQANILGQIAVAGGVVVLLTLAINIFLHFVK